MLDAVGNNCIRDGVQDQETLSITTEQLPFCHTGQRDLVVILHGGFVYLGWHVSVNRKTTFTKYILGPVVQSIVSLTSSLRVISLSVLADSIHNILIFFAEKMWVAMQKLLTFFSAKTYSIFVYHSM